VRKTSFRESNCLTRNEGCLRIKKLFVSKDKGKFSRNKRNCRIESRKPGLNLKRKRKRS